MSGEFESRNFDDAASIAASGHAAAATLHFFVVLPTYLGQESFLVQNTHRIDDQQGSFQQAVETKGHGCVVR